MAKTESWQDKLKKQIAEKDKMIADLLRENEQLRSANNQKVEDSAMYKQLVRDLRYHADEAEHYKTLCKKLETEIAQIKAVPGNEKEQKKRGRPTITDEQRSEVLRLHRLGSSIREIQKSVGIGIGSIHRIIQKEGGQG